MNSSSLGRSARDTMGAEILFLVQVYTPTTLYTQAGLTVSAGVFLFAQPYRCILLPAVHVRCVCAFFFSFPLSYGGAPVNLLSLAGEHRPSSSDIPSCFVWR